MHLALWQPGMPQRDQCPVSGRGEGDFQLARARRQVGRTGAAPRDHEASGPVEVDVMALDGAVAEADGEPSARTGIEDRLVAHPTCQCCGIGEVVEHDVWGGVDVYRG